MAKKVLIIAVALGLALAAGAVASGQKEPAPPTNGPALASPGEKLVLTGSVSFRSFPHPTLKSGGTEYELMVPRRIAYQAGVKEGDEVTVEGYRVQGVPCRAQGEDDDIDLLVTKATINGTVYDLSQFRGPGYGPRGLARGGRGTGMMGGPGYGGWGRL